MEFTVAGGYPPKPYRNDSDTLEAAGIKNGDALNITIVDTPVDPAPAPAPALESFIPPQQPAPVSSVSMGNADAVETNGGLLALRVWISLYYNKHCIDQKMCRPYQMTILACFVLLGKCNGSKRDTV